MHAQTVFQHSSEYLKLACPPDLRYRDERNCTIASMERCTVMHSPCTAAGIVMTITRVISAFWTHPVPQDQMRLTVPPMWAPSEVAMDVR